MHPIYYLFVILGILIPLIYIILSSYKRNKAQVPLGGKYFKSSVGSIYYEVHGTKGPFILCIHGLGASSYCWRKLIPDLSKEHRVLLVDLFGFGLSTKTHSDHMTLDLQTQLLDDLVKELKIKKLNIIGHSMGGHIALWYCQLHPKRINKIITIAPAAHPTLAPKGLKSMSWIANWTPWIINRTIIKRLLNGVVVDHSQLIDEVIDGYFQPYLDPDAHLSFAAALDLIADPRVFDGLHSIQHQVLILWGEKDRVINRKTIDLIQQKLKKPTLETSPRSGHLPLEDDHKWLVDSILSHLRS